MLVESLIVTIPDRGPSADEPFAVGSIGHCGHSRDE